MRAWEDYKDLSNRELEAIYRMCKSDEIGAGRYDTVTVDRIENRVKKAMDERGIKYSEGGSE